MFTVQQIQNAHLKVKSGSDFPSYIKEIKSFGVLGFKTWVTNSVTEYFGANNFTTNSLPKYESLVISDVCNPTTFIQNLKAHQKGETDYYTFCTHCAETGIEYWIVDLNKMTCTYYNKSQQEVLVEKIPE